MGHTHGIKWDDNLVKSELEKVMKSLGIDRMPTFAEIESVTKTKALSMKISKSGGSIFWADKLNLSKKDSTYMTGNLYEKKAIIDIEENESLSSVQTPTKHPYDILVDNRVKIDVKTSNGYDYGKSFWYSFGISKSQHTCDIFIFYCINVADNSKSKTLIIPSSLVPNSQLSIGLESKYDKYSNNWGIISDINYAFLRIETF